MIDALDQHLASVGTNYRIEIYADTEHGFVFPLREGRYHKASAERHWEQLLAMFKRRSLPVVSRLSIDRAVFGKDN